MNQEIEPQYAGVPASELLETYNSHKAAQFPPKLAAALCAVSGSIKKLGKTEKNTFAKYDFVSVDKFYEAVGPLMADQGLHCIPDCIESDVVEGNVKYDKAGNERRGAPLLRERWAFTLIHEAGEVAGPYHRTVTVPAEGAQAHGSSESYAQKQFLRGLFRIPTGDKDDADYGDKPEHAPRRAKPKAQAQAGKAPDVKVQADKPIQLDPVSTEAPDLKAWCTPMSGMLKTAPTLEALDAWVSLNEATLDQVEEVAPKLRARLAEIHSERAQLLSEEIKEAAE